MNATAMLANQKIMVLYHAKARQYLDDHGRLYGATDEQIASVAEWLRYHAFRHAIEPLERQRNKVLTDWLSLQTNVHAEQPEWLKKCVAEWNEIIASVGRKDFGYTSTSGEAK